MKVVIVDDDQLVALSLKTILEADARVTVVAPMQQHSIERSTRMFF